MNNIENKEYMICPCCGQKVLSGKFCPECGAMLSKENIVTSSCVEQNSMGCSLSPSFDVSSIQTIEEHHPVDDSGLTLLGDFCRKTMATVGGDGYDEIVLYKDEKDGSFQIHTYSKYVYMQKEDHRSFKANEGAYDALLRLVEKLHLDEYEGKRGFGLCGGMYICKYLKDGIIHRVTTDNCGTDGPSIIMQVGNLLGSFKGEEISQQP